MSRFLRFLIFLWLVKEVYRCYKNSVLYRPWSKFTALQEDFVTGPCSLQTEQTPGGQLVAVTKKSERYYKTFLKKIWKLIPFFIMLSIFTRSLLFFPIHFFRYFFTHRVLLSRRLKLTVDFGSGAAAGTNFWVVTAGRKKVYHQKTTIK